MTDIIRTTTNFVDSWVANVVQINTVTILDFKPQVVQKVDTRAGGGGGYSWEFFGGVCRPMLQILPRSRTKDVIFHTHFQTRSLKSISFSDLAFRQKLCYHNLD